MTSVEDAPTVRSPVVVDAPPPLVRGQLVDDYVVEALIARGGMSVVYEVRHRILGDAYALKVLDDRVLAGRPERYRKMMCARLRREGRIQGQLAHSSVVRVHRVLEVAGLPALLMDLVDGPTLDVWFRERRDVAWSDVDAVAEGLLGALVEAHAAGVIHRDIKPTNVLMARGPAGAPRWVPRLADFGLAKVRTPHGREDLTLTGQVMGTLGYMPPEQMLDAKHVDPRVDVFAVGAVLFELVIGARVAEAWGEIDEAAIARALDVLRRGDAPERMRRAVRVALGAGTSPGLDAATVQAVWQGHGGKRAEDPATRSRGRPRISLLEFAAVAAFASIAAGWLLL